MTVEFAGAHVVVQVGDSFVFRTENPAIMQEKKIAGVGFSFGQLAVRDFRLISKKH